MSIRKIVIIIISLFWSFMAGYHIHKKIIRKDNEIKELRFNKQVSYFHTLDQWLYLKEKGKSIERYFEKYHYHTVAIYGIGKTGMHLLRELKNSRVMVLYAIDRNADGIKADVPIYTIRDELPLVDVIIVTVSYEFERIKEYLDWIMDCPIVPFEEIIYECIQDIDVEEEFS